MSKGSRRLCRRLEVLVVPELFLLQGPPVVKQREREGTRALAGLGLSGLHAFSLGLQGSW